MTVKTLIIPRDVWAAQRKDRDFLPVRFQRCSLLQSVQTCFEASSRVQWRLVPNEQSGRGVKFTTYLRPSPQLNISGGTFHSSLRL